MKTFNKEELLNILNVASYAISSFDETGQWARNVNELMKTLVRHNLVDEKDDDVLKAIGSLQIEVLARHC